jgi:hypothetical protein
MALGLEVPTVPRLVRMLRAGGLNIPENVVHVHELVSFLC